MAAPRILVTGATDGIGKQIALDLARKGCRVVLHGRNPGKLEAAVDEVFAAAASSACQQGGAPCGTVDGVLADFGSLQAVRDMAKEVAARFPDLSVLVNNAGIAPQERQTSHDGIELTFAVNHLATFVLTEALLPVLIENGRCSNEGTAACHPSRVVTVSSNAHLSFPHAFGTNGTEDDKIDWDNVQSEKSFDPWVTYSWSKLCNVMMTFELARRFPLERFGVCFTTLSPGPVNTAMLRGMLPDLVAKSKTVAQGAEVPVALAVDPQYERTTAEYYCDHERRPVNPLAARESDQNRLVEVSRKLIEEHT